VKPVPLSSIVMSDEAFGSVSDRSGFQWPSAETTASARIVAAKTWLLANALL
jgi:hypothetical protein